jgi:MFS family permease
MVAIGLGTAVLLACLPWLGGLPAIVQIMLLGLLGLGVTGWNGVLMAESARYAEPGQAGRAIGGTLVYTFVGVMIGPSLFATIYEHAGHYGDSFAVLSAVMLAGAAIAGRQMWRHRRGSSSHLDVSAAQATAE